MKIKQEQELENQKLNEKIESLNEDEKNVFNEKFQEYVKTMDEKKAKEEALRDVDVFISEKKYHEKRAADIEANRKHTAELKNNSEQEKSNQQENIKKVYTLQNIADYVVNHAKRKYDVDNYLTSDKRQTYYYSAYLIALREMFKKKRS